uniref:Uncharacterized protein n=1 Tax=Medicago truncatula TaxID=3880 RepID=Q2HUL3_MEDTR|nr:hypothetical protein MtrDRAFT_AC149131g31v2 [Medicago truncatula]
MFFDWFLSMDFPTSDMCMKVATTGSDRESVVKAGFRPRIGGDGGVELGRVGFAKEGKEKQQP